VACPEEVALAGDVGACSSRSAAERLLHAHRRVGHGLPPDPPVELDPEDEVLVAALQHLPALRRLHIVLHYMTQLPEDVVVEWFGVTLDQVGEHLDAGFETLVGILEWPDYRASGSDGAFEGDAYDWTAQALADSGHRLRQRVPVPPPTPECRQAPQTMAPRMATATAAVAALCIGIAVYFSPAPPAVAVATSAEPSAPLTAPAPPEASDAAAQGSAPHDADVSDPRFAPTGRAVERAATRRATRMSRVASAIAVAAGLAVERAIAATDARATSPA
jgi:hypothetical protein